MIIKVPRNYVRVLCFYSYYTFSTGWVYLRFAIMPVPLMQMPSTNLASLDLFALDSECIQGGSQKMARSGLPTIKHISLNVGKPKTHITHILSLNPKQ